MGSTFLKTLWATCIFLSACFYQALAQENRLTPDGIGNYWCISKEKIQKLNSKGQYITHYSNIFLGNPTSIDASDPFRIMVFYHQSQNLVFLNNDATEIGRAVNFPDLGLGEVVIVCRSSLGGAWLLHRETAQLLRFNSQMDGVEQKISLDNRFSEHNPVDMCECGGILYVSTIQGLIARFDTYGTPLPPLTIPHNGSFRLEGNFIWAMSNDVFLKYNLNNPDATPESFKCPCGDIPVTVGKRVVCFNGQELVFCEIITH